MNEHIMFDRMTSGQLTPPGRAAPPRPTPPRTRQRHLSGLTMLVAVLIAAMAVALTPHASIARVPGLNWTNLPTTVVDLPDGWDAVNCAGDAQLLCTAEEGQSQGIVQTASYLLETGDLAADLDAGTPVRLALAREARRLTASIRDDRSTVCPTMAFFPDHITGATVAGLPGIQYGFTLFSGGRVVERTVGFMAVRTSGAGQFLDLATAEELNDGSCESAEATQPFTDGALGRFTPTFIQLVARSSFGPGSRPVPVIAEDVTIDATDAADVAIALSRLAVPDPDTASTVLIARDDDFADALASGGAQGLLDAPLLLTDGADLDDRVAAEIRRLGAEHAIVLGGQAAVSPAVIDSLHDLSVSVERIGGEDRIATALALVDRIGSPVEQVVLTRAFGGASDPTQAFADSIAAGATAASLGEPLLLTAGDRLDPRVAAWLQQELDEGSLQSVLIAGGQAAIGQAVRQELVEIGLAIDVAEGAERAGTAAELSRRRGLSTADHAQSVVLVDGGDWVSGTAAALFASRSQSPVLLTVDDAVPAATAAFLGQADVAMVRTPGAAGVGAR